MALAGTVGPGLGVVPGTGVTPGLGETPGDVPGEGDVPGVWPLPLISWVRAACKVSPQTIALGVATMTFWSTGSGLDVDDM